MNLALEIYMCEMQERLKLQHTPMFTGARLQVRVVLPPTEALRLDTAAKIKAVYSTEPAVQLRNTLRPPK